MRIIQIGLTLLASVLLVSCGDSNSASEYTVSSKVGPGGSITPDSITVTEGDMAELRVVADNGFVIETVSGCGGVLAAGIYTTDAITADCSVNASFTALAVNVTVNGLVLDTDGKSIAGVEVFNDTGVLATSDSFGAMGFTLADTEAMSIRLRKANYTSQTVVLDVLNAEASFTSTLDDRNLPVIVNADTAFNIAGEFGARVQVAGGTLVDSQGNAVTGDIELNITPVDISDDDQLRVFPGAYAAVDPDGAAIPIIMPYGTVEYFLSQNGEELNLAPGATASIEIPIFVTEHPDGTAIEVGQLGGQVWYLDEVSGQWHEETTGTVVASEDSPTGMALQAIITHFSWWNFDYSVADGTSNDPSDPSFDSYSCRIPVSLINLPADVGENDVIGFFITANTSRPRYARTSYLSDGETLRIPRDINLVVNAEATGENFYTANAVFNCNDAVITLNFSDPLAPIIQRFEASIKPVFELSAANQYEVVRNLATFTWIVAGQDTLTLIEPELPINNVLVSSRGSVDIPLEQPAVMGDIFSFSLVASNEVAVIQVPQNLNYIEESAPLVGRFSFYYTSGPGVQISWDVDGADTVNIGYVLNGGPVANLTYISGLSNISGGMSNLPFNLVPGGGYGYQIVVEYINQYGTTYKTFSRGDCPPDTDLC